MTFIWIFLVMINIILQILHFQLYIDIHSYYIFISSMLIKNLILCINRNILFIENLLIILYISRFDDTFNRNQTFEKYIYNIILNLQEDIYLRLRMIIFQ